MCEIAMLRPETHGPNQLCSISMRLYETMKTALGVVAVIDDDGQFSYRVYKSTDPDRDELWDFIESNHEDTNRFIIHGRLATSGERDEVGAHPIQVDCSKCDVDYVIHNGVLGSGWRATRDQLIEEGHTFQTNVDSEVIAHIHGTVPSNWGEVDQAEETNWDLKRQPAYLLLNEDRMFIRSNHSYNLTESGTLYRGYRRFSEEEGAYNLMILTPTPAVQEVEQ